MSKGIGVREWLGRLVPTGTPRLAAAFDTAIKTRWFPVGSAAKKEAAALTKAGYQIIAAPEHFLVEKSEGPVIAGELQRARAWGSRVAGTVVS